MNKLLKSRKALSPVIASIILVAVTVAVSIAVAAWMGALTFSFTKNDQFQVNSMTFYGTSGSATNAINMSIQNTGSASWTIQTTAQVNTPNTYTVNAMFPTYNHNNNKLNCTNGNTINISIINVGWVSGNQYSVTLLLADGNKITYVQGA